MMEKGQTSEWIELILVAAVCEDAVAVVAYFYPTADSPSLSAR